MTNNNADFDAVDGSINSPSPADPVVSGGEVVKKKRGRKGGRKPILKIWDVAAALGASRGNLCACARQFGVSRTAVSQFIDRHPELQVVLKDVREGLVDEAESALAEAVESRQPWAILFTLRTQGKPRGYVERQQVESVGKVSLVVTEEIIDEREVIKKEKNISDSATV